MSHRNRRRSIQVFLAAHAGEAPARGSLESAEIFTDGGRAGGDIQITCITGARRWRNRRLSVGISATAATGQNTGVDGAVRGANTDREIGIPADRVFDDLDLRWDVIVGDRACDVVTDQDLARTTHHGR